MHVCILCHLVEFAGSHLSRLVHHTPEERAGLLQKPIRLVKLLHLPLVHHLEQGERGMEGERRGRGK